MIMCTRWEIVLIGVCYISCDVSRIKEGAKMHEIFFYLRPKQLVQVSSTFREQCECCNSLTTRCEFEQRTSSSGFPRRCNRASLPLLVCSDICAQLSRELLAINFPKYLKFLVKKNVSC